MHHTPRALSMDARTLHLASVLSSLPASRNDAVTIGGVRAHAHVLAK
jgi:hypothetical protein